ncbi:MAG: Trm112 family protein [Desulfovibrio sp.]|nr:Trm112 family protein [Desulfovibrio sp.]
MNRQELIEILVCPTCKGSLQFLETGAAAGFGCPACKVVYPIEDDIPIMLAEQAIPQEKWLQTKGNAQCES